MFSFVLFYSLASIVNLIAIHVASYIIILIIIVVDEVKLLLMNFIIVHQSMQVGVTVQDAKDGNLVSAHLFQCFIIM